MTSSLRRGMGTSIAMQPRRPLRQSGVSGAIDAIDAIDAIRRRDRRDPLESDSEWRRTRRFTVI